MQGLWKPKNNIAFVLIMFMLSGRLTVSRTRTNYGDRSFAVQGPRTWNSLPADLRAPDISVETFRHKLKTFLFAVRLSIQRISCNTRFCAIKMHLIIIIIIISASTSALYHLEHPQIRTSAFYPWPWNFTYCCGQGSNSQYTLG